MSYIVNQIPHYPLQIQNKATKSEIYNYVIILRKKNDFFQFGSRDFFHLFNTRDGPDIDIYHGARYPDTNE